MATRARSSGPSQADAAGSSNGGGAVAGEHGLVGLDTVPVGLDTVPGTPDGMQPPTFCTVFHLCLHLAALQLRIFLERLLVDERRG